MGRVMTIEPHNVRFPIGTTVHAKDAPRREVKERPAISMAEDAKRIKERFSRFTMTYRPGHTHVTPKVEAQARKVAERKATDRASILTALAAGPLPAAEISEKTALVRERTHDLLRSLEADGLVTFDKVKGKKIWRSK
jgi:hypothetical protein